MAYEAQLLSRSVAGAKLADLVTRERRAYITKTFTGDTRRLLLRELRKSSGENESVTLTVFLRGDYYTWRSAIRGCLATLPACDCMPKPHLQDSLSVYSLRNSLSTTLTLCNAHVPEAKRVTLYFGLVSVRFEHEAEVAPSFLLVNLEELSAIEIASEIGEYAKVKAILDGDDAQ